MFFYYIIEKGQASTLATQRAFADTCKMRITVETITAEYCNDAQVLHLTILNNSIEYYLSVSINILQTMPCDILQKCGNRKYCTSAQPTRHVVARHMIQHRIIRDIKNIILKFFQIMHTQYLFVRFWITKDEIAKNEMLG